MASLSGRAPEIEIVIGSRVSPVDFLTSFLLCTNARICLASEVRRKMMGLKPADFLG